MSSEHMSAEHARAYDAHGRQMYADGRYLQAATSFTLAAEMLRELADSGSAQGALQYASQLNNIGLCMIKIGRFAEAVENLSEAATIVEPHWSTDSALDVFYAGIISSLAMALAELGMHDRAVELTDQLLPLRRATTDDRFGADPSLARALRLYAQARAGAGRELPRALPAATEAVALYQWLADTDPELFGAELDTAYEVLASVLEKLGRAGDAADIRSLLGDTAS